MWGISVDCIIRWVSPDLAHFVGLEVDDMLGRDFREFVSPISIPTVEKGLEEHSTKTYRQWVETPLGPRQLCITPVWADYRGETARYSHMVPVSVEVE